MKEGRGPGGEEPVGNRAAPGAGSVPLHADCSETVARLYFFLDGALTEEKREAIARHLDECRPCLEAFDFEAELRRIIASRCRDEIPEGLRGRILAALEQERAIDPAARMAGDPNLPSSPFEQGAL